MCDPVTIEVWVCPNCRRWSGSSSTPDLSLEINHRTSLRNLADEDPSEWGKAMGPRSECQHCKAQNITVERIFTKYIALNHIVDLIGTQIEQLYKEEEKSSRVTIPRRT